MSRKQLWPPRAAPASDPELRGAGPGAGSRSTQLGVFRKEPAVESQTLSPGAPLTWQHCLSPKSPASWAAVKSPGPGVSGRLRKSRWGGAWAPPGEKAASGNRVLSLPQWPLGSSGRRPCVPVHGACPCAVAVPTGRRPSCTRHPPHARALAARLGPRVCSLGPASCLPRPRPAPCLGQWGPGAIC